MGGWTPEMTGDKLEAKTHLECSKQGKSRGKQVTWASRRESYLSFSVLSSLEKMGVPGSGKPMAMK